jgi:N6-adenosine-specific RNA methylase IME4
MTHITTSVSHTPGTARGVPLRCSVCSQRFRAARRDAITCSNTCRLRRSRQLRAATPPLPAGPFDLILADPPWPFATYSDKGQGRSPEQHYRTLDLPAIRRLPVAELAARDALLAIWTVGTLEDRAHEVIAAWGFTFVSVGLTWVKPSIGLGYYTRKQTERLLLARRGRGLVVRDHGVAEAIHAPPGRHSAKPAEAHVRLERLFGPVRRLELFARQARPDWTCWGNQLDAAAAP